MERFSPNRALSSNVKEPVMKGHFLWDIEMSPEYGFRCTVNPVFQGHSDERTPSGPVGDTFSCLPIMLKNLL